MALPLALEGLVVKLVAAAHKLLPRLALECDLGVPEVMGRRRNEFARFRALALVVREVVRLAIDVDDADVRSQDVFIS